MTKTLEKEEIKNIEFIQKEYELIYYNIGRIEYQKSILLEKLKELEIKEKELGKELVNKYGEGSINLELGTFTSNE
jgi:hypothetical protein